MGAVLLHLPHNDPNLAHFFKWLVSNSTQSTLCLCLKYTIIALTHKFLWV